MLTLVFRYIHNNVIKTNGINSEVMDKERVEVKVLNLKNNFTIEDAYVPGRFFRGINNLFSL